ncbi:MAG: hypothetical protein ACJA2K_000173 [Thalassolituus sp.]
MNYKDRVIEAIKYTQSLGLNIEKNPLPFDEKLAHSIKQQVYQLCAEALHHYGYEKSSDLAGKCTPVHLMLQSHLKSDLSIDSFITVGDRFWDDYVYCEMTKESIENELHNRNINEPIKAHVWLTLTDGTILDCTAEAHADLLFKRGEHPAAKCIMIVEPDKEENAKSGYHRPALLGIGFLEKTGMVHVRHL